MPLQFCKTVAFYLPSMARGGAETVFLRLAREFSSLGRRTVFILDRAEGPLLDAALEGGAEVQALGAARTLSAVRLLAGWLDETQPDVLLSAISHNNIAAILANRLTRRPCRVVVSEHADPNSHAVQMGGWRYRLLPWAARLVYPFADAVVGVSPGVSRSLVDRIGIPGGKVATIWNPVVTTDFESRAAAAAPHPWLEGGSMPVVMAAGRLAAVKDFGTFLAAIAALRRFRPVRAILLGDGPERESLLRLRDSLGLADTVELPGAVDDTLPWFSRAAAVAVTSVSEGFALTLVEAMACGTAVASTDCPVGPRDVLDGGRYGPLTPVGDAAAMAAALAGLLDAPPPAALLRARALEFSASRSAEAYLRMFDRLCAGRQGKEMPGPTA